MQILQNVQNLIEDYESCMKKICSMTFGPRNTQILEPLSGDFTLYFITMHSGWGNFLNWNNGWNQNPKSYEFVDAWASLGLAMSQRCKVRNICTISVF